MNRIEYTTNALKYKKYLHEHVQLLSVVRIFMTQITLDAESAGAHLHQYFSPLPIEILAQSSTLRTHIQDSKGFANAVAATMMNCPVEANPHTFSTRQKIQNSKRSQEVSNWQERRRPSSRTTKKTFFATDANLSSLVRFGYFKDPFLRRHHHHHPTLAPFGLH